MSKQKKKSAWVSSWTKEKSLKFKIVAYYYIHGMGRKLVHRPQSSKARLYRALEEILKSPDFVPTADQYDAAVNRSKYGSLVLEEHFSVPQYKAGDWVILNGGRHTSWKALSYHRAHPIPDVQYKRFLSRRDEVLFNEPLLVLHNAPFPIIDERPGSKTILLLPLGASHPILSEERNIEKRGFLC